MSPCENCLLVSLSSNSDKTSVGQATASLYYFYLLTVILQACLVNCLVSITDPTANTDDKSNDHREKSDEDDNLPKK